MTDLPTATGQLRIRGANREKWRRLPSRQLAVCQEVLRQYIELYSYHLEPKERVRAAWRGAYRLEDIARRVPQKLRGFLRRRMLYG